VPETRATPFSRDARSRRHNGGKKTARTRAINLLCKTAACLRTNRKENGDRCQEKKQNWKSNPSQRNRAESVLNHPDHLHEDHSLFRVHLPGTIACQMNPVEYSSHYMIEA
jgi:hypothetical protein